MEKAFFNQLKTYLKQEELQRVRKAYQLADYLHRDAKRDSGEPYIIHPLNVAYILVLRKADVDTICAALLHDTIEDTDILKEELAKEFNNTIAELVDGVSKLKGRNLHEKQRLKYANTRKLLSGFLVDPRIIIIKTADRLHNMRTIMYKKEEKQIENSLETLTTYVPMANLIGTSIYLNELASRAFHVIKRKEYEETESMRTYLEEKTESTIKEIEEKIKRILKENQIPNQIKFRCKNNYQLFQQLRKGKKIEEIKDLLAMKIIVKNIYDCYKVMDLIKQYFDTDKEKEKDFIASPKDNLYQSIHLVLMKEIGNIQVQIKTERMEKIANYGLASYWEFYGIDAKQNMEKDLKNKMFYQTLANLGEFYEDNKQFVEQVQIELFGDKIYTYTPQGKLIVLPKHATLIDFASQIHSEVLQNMVGARVNGVFVPINYELKNKDQVMILTEENGKAFCTDWEQYATTTSAKRIIQKIKK